MLTRRNNRRSNENKKERCHDVVTALLFCIALCTISAAVHFEQLILSDVDARLREVIFMFVVQFRENFPFCILNSMVEEPVMLGAKDADVRRNVEGDVKQSVT